ncbi:MAG: hypothetical protein V3U72_03805 [Candidatus Aenigmarchaeota archaeon]
MKLILVTGLAGIDKKTIIDLALQRAGRKKEFKVVDFDTIGNLAEDMKNATDLETARNLLSKFYTDIEKVMISDLKEKRQDIIVNGYLTMGTTYGYMGAIPEEFFRSFKPDNIVILEKGDDAGERIDPKMNEHQHINRYYGAMYSSLCSSVLKIVRFREKRMMEAVKEISDLIKH